MPTIPKILANDTMADTTEAKQPQSKDRAEVASRVYSLFENAKAFRDQTHELFRDRSFVNYINDNTKRFIQFKRRPAHKKDWQSNQASSTPNEKLISILSRLATQGMEARAKVTDEISQVNYTRERICNYLLKGAAIKNDDDFQIILEMLEAAEKGTVIGFEDWYHGKRDIREITDQDPETGELKFTKKTIKEWNDVRSSLVNLEDFYPGNVYVRPGCIQDMDYCFLRTTMTEDKFTAEFGKYPDADLVTTKNSTVNESTPFWKQSQDIKQDLVEVIRMFNKATDELVILANQIWINPIGAKTVSPLPWNHKKLPFWGGVFEPLDVNWFYGRSFIDKLISICDGQDALFDRMIDQMTISIGRPIITDGNATSLTKGFLQPMNIITADFTNGKPNIDVLPIPDPSPVGFNLYQLMQNRAENASMPMPSPGLQRGSHKTAEQVATERESALQVISLFRSLMEKAFKDKINLRFPNILQFYTMPVHSSDTEVRFKRVILRNETLSNGKSGSIQLSITPDINQQRVEQQGGQTLEPTEFIEITPEFIRNTKAEIEIVPQSSVKMTENQRQVLELNFQRVMMELYPDKFNRDAGFEEMVNKFGKDPQKLKAQTPAAQGDMGPGMGIPPMPGGSSGANLAPNGGAGGQSGQSNTQPQINPQPASL